MNDFSVFTLRPDVAANMFDLLGDDAKQDFLGAVEQAARETDDSAALSFAAAMLGLGASHESPFVRDSAAHAILNAATVGRLNGELALGLLQEIGERRISEESGDGQWIARIPDLVLARPDIREKAKDFLVAIKEKQADHPAFVGYA